MHTVAVRPTRRGAHDLQSPRYNNATSYCKIGSYSAKAMIAAVDGKEPSAEIVGHVDPDTPHPALPGKKK